MELFLFLGSLFVFLCFGIPIAMVLVLCAMVLMFHADMWDPMTIASCMLDGANNYPLMAIPFFVFAGESWLPAACRNASCSSPSFSSAACAAASATPPSWLLSSSQASWVAPSAKPPPSAACCCP